MDTQVEQSPVGKWGKALAARQAALVTRTTTTFGQLKEEEKVEPYGVLVGSPQLTDINSVTFRPVIDIAMTDQSLS